MRLDNLFFDVWRMLSKNKFSVILLILQVCISFTLLGSLFTQTYQTQNVAEAYDDTYRGKIYYQMSDCLNDEDYYEYLYDNGEGYAKLRKFLDSIRNNQALSYIMLNNQDVEIKEKYPDIFLSGYEDGMGGSYELEGEIWYPMKSLQVSQNFFAEFGIAVSKGHMFRNEDSIYTENSSIPILLGSEYMPYVSSGDILHGYYLCEPFRLQVIGFLDESTFFYDWNAKEMVSLARYIIVPAKQFVMDQPTSFDRICLLTQMNGIIVSDSPYHVVAKELDDLKAKAGIPHWDIDVRDPDQQYEPMDLFKTYSAMTNEVVKQFRIIMLIALLFLIVSMSITISGVIREKQYEYGVQLLSGASPAYILTTAYTSVGLLVVTGECIAMVSLANAINAEAALIMLLFMVIIWILSSIVPVRMVLRMNITTIIGGRD